jgi:pyridoxine kinase
VALPVVSGFGVECRVLPTALLSTHTGGFDGFTYLDLTDEMLKIIDAWRPLSLRFDAVYSGFLASAAQIDIVKLLISEYREGNTIAVIDPVMGDHGRIYKIFDADFVKKMSELVPFADVLTPNITEACLLTGTDYKDEPHGKPYIEELLARLKAMGAKNVVLTGVALKEGQLGVACHCENSEAISYYFQNKIDGAYHGTGDIFGSVLTGMLMRGNSLADAAAVAVDFVVSSIKATPKDADRRYGVDFEAVLADFRADLA